MTCSFCFADLLTWSLNSEVNAERPRLLGFYSATTQLVMSALLLIKARIAIPFLGGGVNPFWNFLGLHRKSWWPMVRSSALYSNSDTTGEVSWCDGTISNMGVCAKDCGNKWGMAYFIPGYCMFLRIFVCFSVFHRLRCY